MSANSGEEKLEVGISYILVIGVIASVVVESIGIAGYYHLNGNLDIIFAPGLALKGTDFFSYTGAAVQAFVKGSWTPFHILGLGMVLLMITPYMRVVASVVYFGWARNLKYLLITIFVLVVLTASLLAH
jgi:uncharacterized membrane protein